MTANATPGNEAKASGRNLPVSTKQSIELSTFLRGKHVEHARKLLREVIAHKRAVPYHQFNKDTGHKPGMAAGRYPKNTASHLLKLINSCVSNAEYRGLSAANLIIKHIAAQTGPTVWRYGRQRRRAKRTHIELIVAEKK